MNFRQLIFVFLRLKFLQFLKRNFHFYPALYRCYKDKNRNTVLKEQEMKTKESLVDRVEADSIKHVAEDDFM